MVHGLEHFKEYFTGYEDQYTLIGGSACSVVIEDLGGDFRATDDLDLVIAEDALSRKFVDRFWEYIDEGKYNYKRKSDGHKTFYRFDRPAENQFPKMLEILSTNMLELKSPSDQNIARLTVEEEIISLSAMLLNDDYYKFIHDNKIDIDGLSTVSISCLIPLKIRAWLDLKEKKIVNTDIRSRDVNKHKNDVLRLEAFLPRVTYSGAPDCVKDDVNDFVKEINIEKVDLKSLGIRGKTLDNIIKHLLEYYISTDQS